MTATSSLVPLKAADAAAVEALQAADPAWVALERVADVIDLPQKLVLHAGPPIEGRPCAPIRNSAAMAVLYEGWAESEGDAFAMIDRGAVRLEPAQDHDVVVPLAGVLTASMFTHIVEDRTRRGVRALSPINGGNGPAIRLGKAGADVVRHLHWINGEFAQYLRQSFAREIPLVEIASEALEKGDDLHGRTLAATTLLSRALFGEQEPIAFVKDSPSLFLNLWMAACKCMSLAAGKVGNSSAVVAIGSNGVHCGLKIAGMPRCWFTAPALPPDGALEPDFSPADRLGAIGDSAIVDACGFGAMAMHCAPVQQSALGKFMPAPSRQLTEMVMGALDRRFSESAAVYSGLTACRVAAGGAAPAISLGILDQAGRVGRIGGGIFLTPREPFVAACQALQENSSRERGNVR